MSSITSAAAMKLLDIRLKHAGSIITSAIGEFSTTDVQEIVCLRAGGTIDLYRIVVTTVSKDNNDDEDDEDGPGYGAPLPPPPQPHSHYSRTEDAVRRSAASIEEMLVTQDLGMPMPMSMPIVPSETTADDDNDDESIEALRHMADEMKGQAKAAAIAAEDSLRKSSEGAHWKNNTNSNTSTSSSSGTEQDRVKDRYARLSQAMR